ncbi:hypothetical protein, partial [Methylobacterium oryzisoli]
GRIGRRLRAVNTQSAPPQRRLTGAVRARSKPDFGRSSAVFGKIRGHRGAVADRPDMVRLIADSSSGIAID